MPMRVACLTLILLVVAAAEAAWPRWADPQARMSQEQQVAYTPEAEVDRVAALPGQPNGEKLDFGLFSGYVDIADTGRSLYYIFAEARKNAADAPLVLWLNGGPGCSSIGGGFMSELGPWYPTPGGRALQRNPYSWNDMANMIWLDSPAGVGWSIFTEPEDAVVGDKRTADDARLFVLGFLQRFPQYANSDFYISGESYGGHYVPNLALAIHEGNKQARLHNDPEINLKGMLIGNAWTDAAIDNRGALDFWYTHAMISDDAYFGMRDTCNFEYIGPLMRGKDALLLGSEAANKRGKGDCGSWLEQANDERGNINIYEIYADVCIEGSNGKQRSEGRYLGALLGKETGRLRAKAGRYDPCVDGEVEAYLNRADVQAALHANQTGRYFHGSTPWSDCTDAIMYSRQDLLSSMLPVYRMLLREADLKVFIFSGDVDGIVPVLGSRRWVASLGLPVSEPWRPWASSSGQVAGWRIDYEGLTFITVRNAGHMVPYVQPERAYYMFREFLEEGASPSPSAALQDNAIMIEA